MTDNRTARTLTPACWSWPAERPGEDEVTRKFWEGIDTTDYSASALGLLKETAAELCDDEAVLRTWQDGRCAVCGETDRTMVCDHDHGTGLVRGWLCVSCNTREGVAIGMPGTTMAAYRDRPPTAILGLTIRYRDPFARRYAVPEPARKDGWDDSSSADLT